LVGAVVLVVDLLALLHLHHCLLHHLLHRLLHCLLHRLLLLMIV
jgi:hypothetical protein